MAQTISLNNHTENFDHTTIAKVILFQKSISPTEAAMSRGNVFVGVAGSLVEVAVVVIRHAVRPTHLQNEHLNNKTKYFRLGLYDKVETKEL